MTFIVRPAQRDDMEALVELRRENARTHVELDPGRHRLPDPEAVRDHFRAVLDEPARETRVLVADAAGQVLGMTELVLTARPPDHQIAAERRTAQIHTVVRRQHRAAGVGSELIIAAERLAAQIGVDELVAPVLLANEAAASFYERNGYADYGRLLAKPMSPGPTSQTT
jgi:GNAT superfamily N-acetyltransferase